MVIQLCDNHSFTKEDEDSIRKNEELDPSELLLHLSTFPCCIIKIEHGVVYIDHPYAY